MAKKDKPEGKKDNQNDQKEKKKEKIGGKRVAPPTAPLLLRQELGAVIFLLLGIFTLMGYASVDALFIKGFSSFLKGSIGVGFWMVAPIMLLTSYILFTHQKGVVLPRVISAQLIPLFFSVFCYGLISKDLRLPLSDLSGLWLQGLDLKGCGLVASVIGILLTTCFSSIGTVLLATVTLFFLGLGTANRTLMDLVDWFAARPAYEPPVKDPNKKPLFKLPSFGFKDNEETNPEETSENVSDPTKEQEGKVKLRVVPKMAKGPALKLRELHSHIVNAPPDREEAPQEETDPKEEELLEELPELPDVATLQESFAPPPEKEHQKKSFDFHLPKGKSEQVPLTFEPVEPTDLKEKLQGGQPPMPADTKEAVEAVDPTVFDVPDHVKVAPPSKHLPSPSQIRSLFHRGGAPVSEDVLPKTPSLGFFNKRKNVHAPDELYTPLPSHLPPPLRHVPLTPVEEPVREESPLVTLPVADIPVELPHMEEERVPTVVAPILAPAPEETPLPEVTPIIPVIQAVSTHVPQGVTVGAVAESVVTTTQSPTFHPEEFSHPVVSTTPVDTQTAPETEEKTVLADIPDRYKVPVHPSSSTKIEVEAPATTPEEDAIVQEIAQTVEAITAKAKETTSETPGAHTDHTPPLSERIFSKEPTETETFPFSPPMPTLSITADPLPLPPFEKGEEPPVDVLDLEEETPSKPVLPLSAALFGEVEEAHTEEVIEEEPISSHYDLPTEKEEPISSHYDLPTVEVKKEEPISSHYDLPTVEVKKEEPISSHYDLPTPEVKQEEPVSSHYDLPTVEVEKEEPISSHYDLPTVEVKKEEPISSHYDLPTEKEEPISSHYDLPTVEVKKEEPISSHYDLPTPREAEPVIQKPLSSFDLQFDDVAIKEQESDPLHVMSASAATGFQMPSYNENLADPEMEQLQAQVQEQSAQFGGRVYKYPPLSLLKPASNSDTGAQQAELQENLQRLEATLQSFKIKAQMKDVIQGPSVTRYEVSLQQGEKLSKLTNLSEDIALALGASGVRIAPIADKISTVGIEVPNKAVAAVEISQVLSSSQFADSPSKVSFAVGKDITGQAVVGNIAKMPHLLVAGTTGSGKSVCTNSLIISLLYKASPEEVKLIMVDPKMVELGIYNGIPHLLIPVVTDPKKAAGALQWAVYEMMKRYKLFSEVGTRDLASYNEYAKSQGEEPMAQIVVIIDELADLMLVAAKEVEESICRVAQMGRASGMHLIIATQRPSADVITGLMKANIPSRIAFAVSSGMDSRIILDVTGAEKLVGRGDMLYAPLGEGKPTRVQGCLISDSEVAAVVNFVKKESGTATYSEEIMEQIDQNVAAKEKTNSKNSNQPAPDLSSDEQDDMLYPAIDMIMENQTASVSMLQRKLKLGYARAARIVDSIEDLGIVGGSEGAKGRQILITKEQWQEMKFRRGQAGETQRSEIATDFDRDPVDSSPPWKSTSSEDIF